MTRLNQPDDNAATTETVRPTADSEGVQEAREVSAGDPQNGDQPKAVNAKEVIKFVTDHYELRKTNEDELIGVALEGVPSTWPLGGAKFAKKVARDFSRAEHLGRIPSKTVMERALGIIEADAEERPPEKVHLRSAPYRGGYLIDLGRDDYRAVSVNEAGWKRLKLNVDHPLFKREGAQVSPLPAPGKKGPSPLADPDAPWRTYASLLGFDYDSHEFAVVRGWLCCVYMSNINRPLLWLDGPPGSSKTGRAELIVAAVDPRMDHSLAAAPTGDTESNRVAASASYVVAYDNVSHWKAGISNFLCTMVTGETTTRRKRYHDKELSTISLHRTGVVTGLSLPTSLEDDALTRIAEVRVGSLDDAAKLGMVQLRREFAALHPALFEAILDAMVTALRKRYTATAPAIPTRFVEYCELLNALDHAGSDGGQYFQGASLLEAYLSAGKDEMSDRATEDPLVCLLAGMMATGSEDIDGFTDSGYKGYPAPLREALEQQLLGESGLKFKLTANDVLGHAGWFPDNASALGRKLGKIDPLLRAVGIIVVRPPRNTRGAQIVITMNPKLFDKSLWVRRSMR